ncbi:MAG TPA: hypothetical protein VF074_04790 [Pyrinomonadaceae bacterium]
MCVRSARTMEQFVYAKDQARGDRIGKQEDVEKPSYGWIDVRRGERGKAFSMALFFFLTTATFWALKPMKRGLLISYHKEHPLEFLGSHLGARKQNSWRRS